MVKARWLDPGIREAVLLLRDAGFETSDSGDGRSKPPAGIAYPFPHVIATTTKAQLLDEADRMLATLTAHPCGIKGWVVEAIYSTRDGCVLFAKGKPLGPVQR